MPNKKNKRQKTTKNDLASVLFSLFIFFAYTPEYITSSIWPQYVCSTVIVHTGEGFEMILRPVHSKNKINPGLWCKYLHTAAVHVNVVFRRVV